jgi:hypothetical protein
MIRILLVSTVALIGLVVAGTANAGNIIEDWGKVKAPPVPKLETVSVSAKDTALISMDLQSTSCIAKRGRVVSPRWPRSKICWPGRAPRVCS